MGRDLSLLYRHRSDEPLYRKTDNYIKNHAGVFGRRIMASALGARCEAEQSEARAMGRP